MGRKVKCQITNVYGDSDNFYRSVDGKYYQSKELYLQEKRDKLVLQKINELLLELLNLKTYPSYLGKIIKDFHENHSYDVIYLTIATSKSNIRYALQNKQFKNEYSMLRYINAILSNNINDVEKAYQRKKHSAVKNVKIDNDVFENQRTNTKKKKDITKWL